ncbi:MAG: response regulator transcription factor [Clostridia bacterium]|nr:response regulator transcription factor [Clostridia bacterium]
MIKVMLVDDQMLLAEGIKAVLKTSPDLEVISIAADGEQALAMCADNRPDVVLMDIRMPNMNGVVATKKIKEFDNTIKVLILTTFDDSDYILSAINNGASGYLLKDVGAQALIDSIKNAYAGDTILPSKIAKKITDAAAMVASDREYRLRNTYGFSDREVEIALMIADGFTNRQIASALKLADGTARNYISTIYLKLGADSRSEAIQKIKNMG